MSAYSTPTNELEDKENINPQEDLPHKAAPLVHLQSTSEVQQPSGFGDTVTGGGQFMSPASEATSGSSGAPAEDVPTAVALVPTMVDGTVRNSHGSGHDWRGGPVVEGDNVLMGSTTTKPSLPRLLLPQNESSTLIADSLSSDKQPITIQQQAVSPHQSSISNPPQEVQSEVSSPQPQPKVEEGAEVSNETVSTARTATTEGDVYVAPQPPPGFGPPEQPAPRQPESPADTQPAASPLVAIMQPTVLPLERGNDKGEGKRRGKSEGSKSSTRPSKGSASSQPSDGRKEALSSFAEAPQPPPASSSASNPSTSHKSTAQRDASKSAKHESTSDRKGSSRRRSASALGELPPLAVVPTAPELVSEGPIPRTPRIASEASQHPSNAISLLPRPTGGPQLVVTVKDASPMTPNENIVHPFVRVWMLSSTSGASLVYGSDCGAGGRPCGVTSPFDIRSRKCRAPAWNQEIVFDLMPEALEPSSTAMLLVELLDFGDHAVNGGWVTERYSGWDGLYPIAWGYYRVPHRGIMDGRQDFHLQMFPFPERQTWLERLGKAFTPSSLAHAAYTAVGPQGPLDPNMAIPRSFRVFADPSNRKATFPVGITIRLKVLPTGNYIAMLPATSPYELALEEYLRAVLGDGGAEGRQEAASMQMRKKLISDVSPIALKRTSKYATLDYSRRRDERALPPSTILHDIAIHGTTTAVAMCPANRLLAVAVVSNFTTVITIYDIHNPSFSAVAVLKGHADMVHSLCFSPSADFLASGSADKTAKIWNLTNLPLFVRSSEDELIACVATYSHGFSVYGAVFVGNALVVGGYDTRLHVWRVPDIGSDGKAQFDESPLLQTVQHSTAFFTFLKITDNNKLWAIDSTHQFMLWRAELDEGSYAGSLQLRRKLECPGATTADIRGNVAVVSCPTEHCILIVDTNAFLATHRIATGKRSSFIPASVLSDGKVVAVGTGNGRLLAWDVATGDLISSRNGYAKAQVQFPIDLMTFGTNQMAVVATATANEDGESKIAVLGRPRKEAEVVSVRDPRADDLVRSLFGGEVNLTRKTGGFDPIAISPSGGRGGAPAAAASSDGGTPHMGPVRDRKSRMDQIMAYWNGLVQGKAKGNESAATATTPRLTSPYDATFSSPPNVL